MKKSNNTTVPKMLVFKNGKTLSVSNLAIENITKKIKLIKNKENVFYIGKNALGNICLVNISEISHTI